MVSEIRAHPTERHPSRGLGAELPLHVRTTTAVETDPDANIEAEIESDIEAINTDLDELEADLAS